MNYRTQIICLLSLIVLSISLTSCLKDSCEETRSFILYEAIYAHPDDFRKAPTFLDNRKMEITGKIYYYNDILMINEQYEGIHLIDNTNPEAPINMGFLAIPGNLDVAISNNIMYADSYVDLLTIDVSDFENPTVLCRDEEVFQLYEWIGEEGYYIGNKETPTSIEVNCTDPNFGSNNFWRGNDLLATPEASFDSDVNIIQNKAGGVPSSASITGVGGSFAKFSVIDNYLYVINNSELVAYSLENPSKPFKTQTTTVAWDIETLFAYKEHLFIGGNNGMFIYDRANPAEPSYVSEFRHAQACDPVFVKDDIAYVTLRNGSRCQNFINQLDIIDVSNISNPQLIESYDMQHPHGISVRNNNIYVCEGQFGLKVYENDDLRKIDKNRIDHIKDLHAYDAISLSNSLLMVIGQDGLYQYDTSDPSDLKELSVVNTIQ